MPGVPHDIILAQIFGVIMPVGPVWWEITRTLDDLV